MRRRTFFGFLSVFGLVGILPVRSSTALAAAVLPPTVVPTPDPLARLLVIRKAWQSWADGHTHQLVMDPLPIGTLLVVDGRSQIAEGWVVDAELTAYLKALST